MIDGGEETIARLKDEIDKAISQVFKVTIFGQSGNGKTSLVNSIFGTNFETDDARPCTKEPNKHVFSGDGKNLHFVDMPGFGEENDVDNSRQLMWASHASDSDVILLTLDATSRSIEYDLNWVKNILPQEQYNRLIIVCNKADLLEVEDGWQYIIQDGAIRVTQTPPLKELMNRKTAWIEERRSALLTEKIPIIFCSGKSGYGLVALCKSILKIIPVDANLAFSSFVDSGIIGKLSLDDAPTCVPRKYLNLDRNVAIFTSQKFR